MATVRTYPERLKAAISKLRTLSTGHVVPELNAVGLDGGPITLAQLRGMTVYLEFWATNCGPCVAELPATLAL